jgi:hypothetical protein
MVNLKEEGSLNSKLNVIEYNASYTAQEFVDKNDVEGWNKFKLDLERQASEQGLKVLIKIDNLEIKDKIWNKKNQFDLGSNEDSVVVLKNVKITGNVIDLNLQNSYVQIDPEGNSLGKNTESSNIRSNIFTNINADNINLPPKDFIAGQDVNFSSNKYFSLTSSKPLSIDNFPDAMKGDLKLGLHIETNKGYIINGTQYNKDLSEKLDKAIAKRQEAIVEKIEWENKSDLEKYLRKGLGEDLADLGKALGNTFESLTAGEPQVGKSSFNCLGGSCSKGK